MFLSTFPTGTVSSDRLGSRTFPPEEGTDGGTQRAHGRETAVRWAVDGGRSTETDASPEGESRRTAVADQSTARRHTRAGSTGVTITEVDRPADSGERNRRRRGDFPDGPAVRVAELEHENAQLRARLSKKEGDLQDVIDRYEHVLAQRQEARRRRSRQTSSSQAKRASVLRRLRGAIARLIG